MFVISILTEHATMLFELHMSALMNLFGSVLTKPECHGSALAYLTVISMKNFLLCYPKREKTVRNARKMCERARTLATNRVSLRYIWFFRSAL